MVHGENRIPYRIDRRLSGLAGPDYDATISFGLPIEPEDSQYGKYRSISLPCSLQPSIRPIQTAARATEEPDPSSFCERTHVLILC